MKKVNILQRIEEAGVIAVLRGETKEEVLKTSHAVIKGGIRSIELTFTVPEANEIIKELADYYKGHDDVVIGAGTVLDATTARLAIMAGAQYIVSPSFNPATAEMCNLYQIPYLPGCMTITEMETALKSGVDIVKLFPGSVYGPSVVKAFKAPLPYLNIMPTGGVSIDNMAEWFNEGVVAVGVGGNLLEPVKTGDFDKVTELAAQYMDKYREIKGLK
ncbi:bifunctional 4-hydroxy-2-oxoglutarate aldolase/2-dehydro-3-deoxy-phosphogluconate aldolase [Carnobacterium sp. FSL W8-0810]|uniref:bifunctional 4-hydroxy-2-oxoglutarate aldolase/2-dehydro-3-deoxy-phosphogluconate aldolase n=1 Tax=Carnobacterium sp. FSL W8-0810 TaxID=2954705 RepID=UPI0030FA4584